MNPFPMALVVALALLPSRGTLAETSEQQTIKSLAAPVAAPQFRLEDLDGKSRALSDYQGKIVAVNFWATWCPPCRKELPSMQRTYEAYRDRGFEILGVNVGEDWDTVAPFLEQFGLTYPILFDADTGVLAQWQVMGLPTTFIVDRDGRVTHAITGGRDWDDAGFRAQLQAVIEGARSPPVGLCSPE